MSKPDENGLEYHYEDAEKLAELRPKLAELISTHTELISEEEPDFAQSEDTLNRFLRARNYDVSEAHKQLKSTLEWRKEFRPCSVRCAWCDETPGYHSMRQIGHDKLGRPIIYACFAQAQTHKNTVEDSITHTAYLIENAKKTMHGTASMWVFVIDCTGMTLPCCNPKLGFGVAQACGSFYPERLGKIFVVNHNIMFNHVWRAIKVFLDPKTATKMKLLKNHDKMRKHFGKYFDRETVSWLEQEIKLNAKHITQSQLRFWEPAKSGDHDPRGTKSYIDQYVAPLSELKNRSDIPANQHRCHPNLLGFALGERYGPRLSVDVPQTVEPEQVDEKELEKYGLSKQILEECDEEKPSSKSGLETFKGMFNRFKI